MTISFNIPVYIISVIRKLDRIIFVESSKCQYRDNYRSVKKILLEIRGGNKLHQKLGANTTSIARDLQRHCYMTNTPGRCDQQ